MSHTIRFWVLALLVVMLWFVCTLRAEETCQPPPVVTAMTGSNIFTEQQEIDLGEVLAGQLLRYSRVTDDTVVTDYLARIGERLAKYLPQNQLRFHYFLVDLPEPETYSIPGGRIYVSRRLVSEVQNEGELASIIGHEMGHIVTHQAAINMTALLQQVLMVTAVSDRQDILKKYDALQENWRRNPEAFRRVARRGLESQLIADQVGLNAMIAAGYSPQSFADIFDRTAGTSGKTGNWLSDFLHTTKPNQFRLHELLKSVETMSKACVERQPLLVNDDFQHWREAVAAFSGWNRKGENLHGVLTKVKLDPILRPNIQDLKFSPNGKYLLAEHADTIYVLTREPFAYSFQIHAPDIWQPQFTPDSKFIAFTNGKTRVELWDIAGQKLVRVDQPSIPEGCVSTLLAPDANTLACLRPDGEITLIDLPGGARIFEKKGFARYAAGPKLGFSPDGRYFLAARRDSAAGFDVRARQNIRLPSELKERLAEGFVFLGPDRLLVLSDFGGQIYHGAWRPPTLFAFPSGKVIDSFLLTFQTVSAPAHGDYGIIRPFNDHAVGVMDLKTREIFLTDNDHVVDICDDVFVDQRPDGELALYDARSRRPLAHTPLPVPPDLNSHPGVVYVSRDLKWLAASRGPIWDLNTGKKFYYLRNFRSGWFDGDRAFYADFPKLDDTPRTIARVALARLDVMAVRKIVEPYAEQSGPFLVVSKPQQKSPLAAVLSPCNWKFPDYSPLDCNVVDEVSDVRTGKMLWSRRFPKDHPGLLVEPEANRALIRWRVSDEGVRDELKNYPQLAERLATLKETKGVYFLEMLDASTGRVLGAQLVDTGGRGSISMLGDRIIVSHQGYAEIYSFTTGLKEGEIFGWPLAHSSIANLVSVRGENQNELAVYDLNTREKKDEFTFSSDIEFDRFSQDGKRLFVLTADQIAYILDVSKPAPPERR